jgi:proline dehydrogenase
MVGLFSRMIVATTIRMPKWFVGWVSRRYVAGPNLESAVKIMKRLQLEGACFTIDVLGEEISSIQEADYFLSEYVEVVKAISEHKIDANLSIKPTAFGLLIDKQKGMQNI